MLDNPKECQLRSDVAIVEAEVGKPSLSDHKEVNIRMHGN